MAHMKDPGRMPGVVAALGVEGQEADGSTDSSIDSAGLSDGVTAPGLPAGVLQAPRAPIRASASSNRFNMMILRCVSRTGAGVLEQA